MARRQLGATSPSTPRPPQLVVQNGTDFDPGLPFGTYKICLNDGTRGGRTEAPAPTTYSTTTTRRPRRRPRVEIPPTGRTALDHVEVASGLLMSRLRHQDGFTLPELLVTMVIAMIVSLATFSLIEFVMKRTGEVGARVETTQPAALRWTRSPPAALAGLRASARRWATRPLDRCRRGPTSLTFFADFTDENSQRRHHAARRTCARISWANEHLTETVVKGTCAGTPTTASATRARARSRQFLTNVVATKSIGGDQTKPIFFRYYKFHGRGTVAANAALPDERDRRERVPRPDRRRARSASRGSRSASTCCPRAATPNGATDAARTRSTSAPRTPTPRPRSPHAHDLLKRLDARAERGFSMFIVIMAMFVTSMFVAAAFAAANGDLPVSGVASKDASRPTPPPRPG